MNCTEVTRQWENNTTRASLAVPPPCGERPTRKRNSQGGRVQGLPRPRSGAGVSAFRVHRAPMTGVSPAAHLETGRVSHAAPRAVTGCVSVRLSAFLQHGDSCTQTPTAVLTTPPGQREFTPTQRVTYTRGKFPLKPKRDKSLINK